MNTICKPEESIVPLITSVAVSQDGRYTLDSIDSLIGNFQSTIVTLPAETTNLARLISTYGSDVVFQSNENLNRMLTGIAAPIIPNYPTINERITTGVPITPVEYAEFVTEFLYTPFSLNVDIATDYVKIVTELDTFFADNFTNNSMNSFCSIAPIVFGAIQGFFNLLDSFNDIVSKIQNFSLASLLDMLKEKIIDVIDKTIEKVKGIIENFSLKNIMGEAETFFNEKIVAKALELKETAESFFSEKNIKSLKDKIKGLINYATSLFKNPSIEEIQYLIYRFCAFISKVEKEINFLKGPLELLVENYKNAISTLTGRSNYNTAAAVASGAIRYGVDQRRTGVTESQTRETSYGNEEPIDPAEIDNVTKWNNGKGDSRVTFDGGPLRDGEQSWSKVEPLAKIRLMRLQAAFGKQLLIKSAWRSIQRQEELYAKDLADNGGSPSGNVAKPGSSLHNSGLAFDVVWSGINTQTREEFIEMARSKRFGGIGRYGTQFVHIDIGAERSWGS
jgi:hypothetical protein